MDQKALNTFIEVYECGSMHKAAERLFVTQQNVSKTILSLEDELSTALFQRTSKGALQFPSRACPICDSVTTDSCRFVLSEGSEFSHFRIY